MLVYKPLIWKGVVFVSNINNLDIVCESKITDAGYVCVSKFFDSDVSRVILVKSISLWRN